MTLFKIVRSSIKNTPNLYRSLVGNKVIDNINNNMNSELNRNNWSFMKLIYLFTDIFIPTLPFRCPSWMPNIIKYTIFGGNSEFIEDTSGNLYEKKNNDTKILFINGILTNRTIFQQNIHCLKTFFNRPIHGIHNNTDSLIMDLIECAIGKSSIDLTEASFLTLSIITNLILDKNNTKIVVICHSQGSLIMSQVLRNLKLFGITQKEYIQKLEIYTFGNCCSHMKYISSNYPYMEHFANEFDWISKMGVNHDLDISEYIDIDGITFINTGKYGHLFNSHYIHNFKNDYPFSKLLKYIHK